MTAMPALLALHLEAALDASETELVRSMSRISISQTMLALNQLREIPVIKKAIPLFELILARKNLYMNPTATSVSEATRQDDSVWNGVDPLNRNDVPHDESRESFDLFIQEMLEYDTLDKWDFGQRDFSRIF